MNTPLTMTVQTLDVAEDGGALRAIEPNADGIYCGVPLGILGGPSRNNKIYNAQKGIQAMTNPKSRFCINVREGNQEGEWGHPLAKKTDLTRMAYIDRTRTSHYIRNIVFDKCESGIVVIRGDIGCGGPYGQFLQESFQDPKRNTAFSIRCLTQPIGNNDNHRAIVLMVTFDAVDGPGFEQCCKRFMASTEDLSVSINDILGLSDRSVLFDTEDINDQQVLDILQTSRVRVLNQDLGIYDPKTGCIVDPARPQSRVMGTHAILRTINHGDS